MIYPDGLATCIAILSEHAVETGQAVRSPLPHNIALTPQVSIALKAGKMLHMPGSTFSLGTLVREDDLKHDEGERDGKISDTAILRVDVLPFTQTNTFYHIPIAFESVA